MSNDVPDLGKGPFGYRKSAVNRFIAERDAMLRDAEARAQAADTRLSELEAELSTLREQSARMDEQLERLRLQLEAVLNPSDEEPTPHPVGATSPRSS